MCFAAGRRQPRRAAQQQQAPAAPYEAPFANSGNSGYYDNNYYDPGQQNAPQMFDNPPAAPVHQPFMQAGDAYYAQPSGGFGGPQVCLHRVFAKFFANHTLPHRTSVAMAILVLRRQRKVVDSVSLE